MGFDCLNCFLEFEGVAGEKLDNHVDVPVLVVELNFVGFEVLVELLEFSFFVLIMLDLSEVEEAGALLVEGSFLFLDWVRG